LWAEKTCAGFPRAAILRAADGRWILSSPSGWEQDFIGAQKPSGGGVGDPRWANSLGSQETLGSEKGLSMRQSNQKAFTLVELLVVIAIIGTMMGLLLPAVQASREAGRGNQCRANLTQISLAMQMYHDANEKYPGYIEGLGIDGVSTKGVSWAVMLLPYVDQKATWETWNTGALAAGRTPQIEIFICPSAIKAIEGFPALSYVGNSGNIYNEPDDMCINRTEKPGNGIFFDRFRFNYVDQRDYGTNCCECDDPHCTDGCDPTLQMNMSYIQAHDGTTHTLIFSESLRTVTWADDRSYRADRKWHFGFCWGQPDEVAQGSANGDARRMWRINSQTDTSEYTNLDQMNSADAFPSSHHPSIVNVAFVAGHVRTLNDRIDPLVYAQLMTTNSSTSELVKENSDGDLIPDEELPQPDDSKY
jgi:prepilin-type N-terminal cleavage/methylation domain-containing protein